METTKTSRDLGRMTAVHPVAPVHTQRALIISVLSFLFFLGMMVGFYLRQNIGYFLLATAFLVVYFVTMFSWFVQRKSVIRVFERGIQYKANYLEWKDIESVHEGNNMVINVRDGNPIELPSVIAEPEALVRNIRFHIAQRGQG
jgi:hypothetical protein